jgi:hypothetical protein
MTQAWTVPAGRQPCSTAAVLHASLATIIKLCFSSLPSLHVPFMASTWVTPLPRSICSGPQYSAGPPIHTAPRGSCPGLRHCSGGLPRQAGQVSDQCGTETPSPGAFNTASSHCDCCRPRTLPGSCLTNISCCACVVAGNMPPHRVVYPTLRPACAAFSANAAW